MAGTGMRENYRETHKIILGSDQPTLYRDPGLLTPIGYTLPVDSILDLQEVEDKGVKVELPDQSIAYIDRQAKVSAIKKCWANANNIEVYAQPSEASQLIKIMNLGDEFMLLNAVEENNTSWVRIKLLETIGFMKGSSKCISENSLIKSIGNMVSQRVSEPAIVKSFAKQGIPEGCTRYFYEEILKSAEQYKNTPEGAQVMASKYKKNMVSGLLWAAGGTIATVVGYSMASSSSSGGTYYVFWGAVIFGIFDFLRGLFGWLKYKK